MALATAFPFDLRSHHLALPLFGFAQELGDSAGGRQVRRSGLIEALGRSVMGQGRRPTLKSAAHDAACVPGVVRQPEQPPRCFRFSENRFMQILRAPN